MEKPRKGRAASRDHGQRTLVGLPARRPLAVLAALVLSFGLVHVWLHHAGLDAHEVEIGPEECLLSDLPQAVAVAPPSPVHHAPASDRPAVPSTPFVLRTCHSGHSARAPPIL